MSLSQHLSTLGQCGEVLGGWTHSCTPFPVHSSQFVMSLVALQGSKGRNYWWRDE
ncbi:hypothetical protein E2C01_043659 [Portunus trituberculatus]|uniref:Uncharacterized protein n=1 Tax=Portunus trituberculatus TaxID=210409 RepID=A0A5B7G060_PORTR|nr:hypothetical protein [Portunus trituberculatus]